MQAVLTDAGVPVVDLLSNAPAFDPVRSGYLLAALSRYMPENTLFVTVVDPGVGGARRPLILQTPQHWFVGPDNGVLAQVAKEEGSTVQTIDWFPEWLSASFHGRDLFSPVAVMLCQGEEVSGKDLTPSELKGADSADDLAEIIYIDPFGNGFTGIRAEGMERTSLLSLGGHSISHGRTFSDVPAGTPLWYENSCGLVEIAVNQGRADEMLGLSIGDRVL
jgi:S-adenosylmethionine hydrolase